MKAKRPFSDDDWQATPEPVKQYIISLEQAIASLIKKVEALEHRTEKLESSVNKNSQNSSKPPSSDSPFKKPEPKRKKSKRKKGAQKGHKRAISRNSWHRLKKFLFCRKTVTADASALRPATIKPYYTHQEIELPEIKMDVLHFVLHKGKCRECGRMFKGSRSKKTIKPVYGPRASALIAEMSGIQGSSRKTVQRFLQVRAQFLNFNGRYSESRRQSIRCFSAGIRKNWRTGPARVISIISMKHHGLKTACFIGYG